MKSRLIKKIRCPSGTHTDSTPSCALYADGSGFCFSCRAFFKKLGDVEESPEIVPENLDEKLAYIEGLPVDKIRGLTLPYDNTGYYIVWPDRSYYKLRRWTVNGSSDRYLSPRGIHKTLFVLESLINSDLLIIVEGEINALSLRKAGINCAIICPGSTTNFTERYLTGHLPKLTSCSRILILVDNQYVSFEAALNTKVFLNQHCLNIRIILMDKDCNEILVERGEQALKKEIEDVEMP
jgi:hypothetical protein